MHSIIVLSQRTGMIRLWHGLVQFFVQVSFVHLSFVLLSYAPSRRRWTVALDKLWSDFAVVMWICCMLSLFCHVLLFTV